MVGKQALPFFSSFRIFRIRIFRGRTLPSRPERQAGNVRGCRVPKFGTLGPSGGRTMLSLTKERLLRIWRVGTPSSRRSSKADFGPNKRARRDLVKSNRAILVITSCHFERGGEMTRGIGSLFPMPPGPLGGAVLSLTKKRLPQVWADETPSSRRPSKAGFAAVRDDPLT
jgi:hypothetical protein